MNLLGALLVVVVFAMLVHALRLPSRTMEVAVCAREATAVLKEPGLDDDAKEKVLQGLAMRLFGLLGLLTVGSLSVVRSVVITSRRAFRDDDPRRPMP